MKQTMKRNIINFRPAFVWGVIGLAVVFASGWFFQSVAVSPTLLIVLALFPLLPGGLFLYYLERIPYWFTTRIG